MLYLFYLVYSLPFLLLSIILVFLILTVKDTTVLIPVCTFVLGQLIIVWAGVIISN